MTVELIESTSNSLTVSWTEVPGAVRYVLQYKKFRKADSQSEDDGYETLSNKLTSTQARKKNLEDPEEEGFMFRVGAIASDDEDSAKDWQQNDAAFHLIPKDAEERRMKAVQVANFGANQTARLSWDAVSGASGYELQMRHNNGGEKWETIAPSLSGTEVKKKNLVSTNGYQFRVRPIMNGDDVSTPFSPPSDPFVALGLSKGIQSLFNSLEEGTLLKTPKESISLRDALGGKEFILLYASAHWCGPCRNFTPKLIQWYSSLPLKTVEVVFLSADHDQNQFDNYFGSMPWLAVAHDDDARENLMGYIRVQGIPRLVVLDGRTGRIIDNNAVGKPLDVNHWRTLAGH